jgi:hypothetical protein
MRWKSISRFASRIVVTGKSECLHLSLILCIESDYEHFQDVILFHSLGYGYNPD